MEASLAFAVGLEREEITTGAGANIPVIPIYSKSAPEESLYEPLIQHKG